MGERGPISKSTSVRSMGLRGKPSFEPPTQPDEIPDPPDWLSTEQRETWDWIVPALLDAGVPLLKIDGVLLASVCVVMARIRQCEEIIERDGMIVKGSRGRERIHPAFRAAAQQSRALLQLSRKFGMDPASRQRLRLTRPQTEADRKVNLTDIFQ